MSKYYLGVMCGTSLDSIDISIVKTMGDKFKVFGFSEYVLNQKIKDAINSLKSSNHKKVKNAAFNNRFTNLIIEHIKDVMKKKYL